VENRWAYQNHLKELVELVERSARREGLAHTHFDKPVIVTLKAEISKVGKRKMIDIPNIDDKAITDAIIRYQRHKKGTKEERAVWFIEDDANPYLKEVRKTAILSDRNCLEIQIDEIDP